MPEIMMVFTKAFEKVIWGVPRLAFISKMMNMEGGFVIAAKLALPISSLQNLGSSFLPARVFQFF